MLKFPGVSWRKRDIIDSLNNLKKKTCIMELMQCSTRMYRMNKKFVTSEIFKNKFQMISSLYGSLPSTSSLPCREENINPQLSLYSPIDNCIDSMSLAGQWKPISITHSLLPSPCFPISHSRLRWNMLLCLKRAQPEKGDQTEKMEMALLHPLLAA